MDVHADEIRKLLEGVAATLRLAAMQAESWQNGGEYNGTAVFLIALGKSRSHLRHALQLLERGQRERAAGNWPAKRAA